MWCRKRWSLQRKCKWNSLNRSIDKFRSNIKRKNYWCYILGDWGVVRIRIHFPQRWNQFGDTCVCRYFVMWYMTIYLWYSCKESPIFMGLIRIIFTKWELLRLSLPIALILKQVRNGRKRVGKWWRSRVNLPHITRTRTRLSGGSRMWSIRRHWYCSACWPRWFSSVTRWSL